MPSSPETGGFPPPSGPPLPVDLAPPVGNAPAAPAEEPPAPGAEAPARPQADEPWLRDLEVALGRSVPPEGPDPQPADDRAAADDGAPAEELAVAAGAAAATSAGGTEPVLGSLAGAAAMATAPGRRGAVRSFVAMPRWAKIGAVAAVAFGVAAATTAIQRQPSKPANVLATVATSVTIAGPTSAAPTTAAAPTTLSATSTSAATTTTSAATTTVATTVAPTTVAPTTAPAPTTVPGRDAAQVLAAITVTAERTTGYAAAQFPQGAVAADAGGCDVTSQVLRRDSRAPVTLDPTDPCKVTAGQWQGAYDGVTTADPAQLTASWTVSLREAWESGAAAWTAGQRAAYARDVADPRTVQLLSAAVVRARGDRDPAAWLPDGDARCPYVADWLAVKARWGLSMDKAEADRLAAVLRTDCAGLVVAPSAPVPEPPVVDATVPTTVPYYLDCADAARRGVTSIPRGAPGYRPALDGNNNGIACE